MMQDKLQLANELVKQSRALLSATRDIMTVLDGHEAMLNSLLAGLENTVPVEVQYDWSTFPEWANFAATDDDGAVWAYQLVPPATSEGGERWYPDWSGKAVRIVHPIGKGHCTHWRSTLRQRPVKPEIDVWSLVPDEADFVAMDNDGGWWWYTDKPQTSRTGWYSEYGHCGPFDYPRIDGDWKQSLIERPNA